MLLIGVDKYGHGAWYAIRDDADLGLTEKVFLDENKLERKGAKSEGGSKDIPGSIHLIRRTDYLINVLREEHHKPGILDVLSGKAIETPVKEPKGRARLGNSKSSSKKTANGEMATSEKKKRQSGENRDEPAQKVKKSAIAKDSSNSNSHTKSIKKNIKEEPMSEYESMDEAELKVCFHWI